MGLVDVTGSLAELFYRDEVERQRLRESLLSEVEMIFQEAREKEKEAMDGELEEYEPLEHLGTTFDENRDQLGT